MDKKDWSWLPVHMPRVAALIAEKRRELGADWVAECWRHGVVLGEPGWFFAREGQLMVGVLSKAQAIVDLASAQITPTQAFLMLKEKEEATRVA